MNIGGEHHLSQVQNKLNSPLLAVRIWVVNTILGYEGLIDSVLLPR